MRCSLAVVVSSKSKGYWRISVFLGSRAYPYWNWIGIKFSNGCPEEHFYLNFHYFIWASCHSVDSVCALAKTLAGYLLVFSGGYPVSVDYIGSNSQYVYSIAWRCHQHFFIYDIRGCTFIFQDVWKLIWFKVTAVCALVVLCKDQFASLLYKN